ncbi:MAG: autotransporter-associated beta strand repeat-containing protein [Candidatus Gastranaerophilaceae bacterium]
MDFRNKNKISMMKVALACAVLVGSGNFSTESYAVDITTSTQLQNFQNYTNNSTLKLLNDISLSSFTPPELNGSQYTSTLFGNGFLINGSFNNSKDSSLGYSLKNGASLTFDNAYFDSISFTKGNISNSGMGTTNYSILGLIVNNTANFYIKNNSQFNNGTIELNSGVAWGSNSNVTIQGGLLNNSETSEISDSQFLDNNISANAAQNASYLSGAATSQIQGGVISNSGVLKVSNSVFSGNQALSTAKVQMQGSTPNATVLGGVIYNSGNLSIDHSTFSNNTANATKSGSTNGSAKSYGGAIYNDGTLNINSTSFSNNEDNQGANDIYFGSNGVMNVTGTSRENAWKDNDDAVIISGGLASADSDAIINIESGGKLIMSDVYSETSKYLGSINIKQDGVLSFNTSSTSIQDAINNDQVKITENYGGIEVLGSTTGILQNFRSFIGDNVNKVRLIKSNEVDETFIGNLSDIGGSILINNGKLVYQANNSEDNFFNAESSKTILSDNTVFEYYTSSDKTQNSPAKLGNLKTNGTNNSGIFNKTGEGYLLLAGDNSEFLGTTNISEGTLVFEKTASTSYTSGATNIAGGANLNYKTTLSDTLQNVSGAGNLNKYGENDLELIGDNSNLTGKVNVFEGSLSFNKTDLSSYISGSTYVDGGASLNYTTSVDDTLTNISGNGVLNKFGDADLKLIGDNSGLSGGINIENGSLSFEKTNSNTYAESSTYIASGAVLNYTTTLADEIKDISGDGTLNKFGTEDLKLTSDNSGFKGTANINEGSLTYFENNSDKFFDPQATINIKNSTLNYTATDGDKTLTDGTFGNLNLSDNAKLNYTSGVGTTSLNDGFYTSSGNNYLTFNGVSNSNYVLNTDFSSATSDTVKFINSVVNFTTKSEFQTKLTFDNSTVNLMDGSLNEYVFNEFSSENNSNLTIDVSLGETLGSDKLNIVNGDGTLNINSLAILDDNGIFPDGSNNTKTVQIINNTNGSVGINVANPDDLTIAAWSTNIYEYEINASKTSGSAVYNALDFIGKQTANANSLKKMNNYQASPVRGFSLVNNADTYYINEDLGKTEKGYFTVSGLSNSSSIISGLRNGAGEDKGSFFELTDLESTKLTIKNVTIQDASRTAQTIQDGSVLYMNSENAAAELTNVVFKNSSVLGKGGAIAVLNGELSITDSEFVGNSSDGISNDIYIAGGNTVKFTTNDNISSKILSGLSGNGTLEKLGIGTLNLSGVNKDFTGNLTILQGIVDYVQASGGSFTGGSVSMANNTTLNIANMQYDKLNGLASATASAIFNKSGSGSLTVSGDNSGFLGTVNINGGTLNYIAEDEFSRFFNSRSINLADGTNLIVDTNGQQNQFGKNIISASSNTQFTKTGSGDFVLRGNNNNFNGLLTIENGSLTFEKIGTSSFVNGETHISNGAVLNYIASDSDIITNLTNAGTLVKDGSEILTISNYNFTDSGLAEIKAGTLKVLSSTENVDDFDISTNIYANSTLEYIAQNNSTISLDNNSKLNFVSENSNATAKISNADIILGAIVNETGNNIILDNADITLISDNHLGKYTLNNSTLNLMNAQGTSDDFKTYNFAELNSNSANLTIDVSLGNILASDVLNITDGNGKLNLTKLAIVDDNGIFDNAENTKTLKVINNENGNVGLLITDGNPKLADWSTNIYEYEINAAKSIGTSDIFDSVEFKGLKAASPDTLRTMNHERDNVRGFSVVGSDIYHIAQDIDTTLTGEFTVTGSNRNNSIISGERVSYTINPDATITYAKDTNGNYIIDSGNKGSFFEVTRDNTKLTIQNLTIQDAARTTQDIKNGSILYLNNSTSVAEINNVVFKNSSVSGKGGAIAVLNGELSITDSEFVGNSSGGISNDIYIAGGNTVKFTTNDNTSSKILSGLSGNGTLEKLGIGTLNLSGVNKDFTGNLTISQGIVDYVQASGGSFIGGSVSIANATSSLNITNDYTDNLKNLSGNGFVTKTGMAELILSGNNDNFDGQFNIINGKLTVDINSDADTFFNENSKTVLSSGTKIDFNIEAEKNYTVDNKGYLISGNGQLIKTGEGTLVLTGDNSNLKGDVVNSVGKWSNQLRTGTVISNGILEFVADDTIDKMIDGAVQIDTEGTFKVTSTNDTFNLFNDFVMSGVYQSGLYGEGTFITSGDINLSGNNYNFTGRTEVENGTLKFIKTELASFVQGTVDIKTDATIDYSTTYAIGEK